jgi:hypothetical protein
VRLDRWLEQRGGSPLPLVDQDIWQKSLRPRHRPAPPLPPSALVTSEDWNPGDDPRVRELEEARARLIERLIAAGSAAALGTLESFDDLRLLASFLWLPRESSPLRRLGLRIQSPAQGLAPRAVLRGPGFVVELENYRFSSTNAVRQRNAEAARPRIASAAVLQQPMPMRPSAVAAARTTPTVLAPPTPPSHAPFALESGPHPSAALPPIPVPAPAQSTTPLVRPTTPLSPQATHPLEDLHDQDPLATRPLPALDANTLGSAAAQHPARPPEPAAPQGGRRFWSSLLGRRNGAPQPTPDRGE